MRVCRSHLLFCVARSSGRFQYMYATSDCKLDPRVSASWYLPDSLTAVISLMVNPQSEPCMLRFFVGVIAGDASWLPYMQGCKGRWRWRQLALEGGKRSFVAAAGCASCYSRQPALGPASHERPDRCATQPEPSQHEVKCMVPVS